MKIKKIFVSIFLIMCIPLALRSENFWEITTLNDPAAGYIKTDYHFRGNFYLIDNYGEIQFIDSSDGVKNCTNWKMLRNGNFCCIRGYSIKIYNENLQLIEAFEYPDIYLPDRHDLEVLDNGHYLILCNESREMDLSHIVEGGQPDANIIGNILIEIDANGEIYWTWNTFDHYDILDVTSDINLTLNNIDYCHINAFTVDLDGNILVSSRHLDEITKINKQSGDIIWRWGGSECKNNEFNFENDTYNGFSGFSHQHAIVVLPNGNYLMYDNGNLKPEPYSRAVEYRLNISERKAFKVWEYRYSPDIYVPGMGNAQRLSNGNTLINWGESKITEVDSTGILRFELSFKDNMFKVYRSFKFITRMNAKTRNINSAGLYNFNGANKERTNVQIDISSYNGNGSLTVEKHDYAPPENSYSDSDFLNLANYRWVLSKENITDLNGEFIINFGDLNGFENPENMSIFQREKEGNDDFIELSTSYNAASQEISATFDGFGEFVIGSFDLNRVTLSSPVNNKMGVFRTGILKWQKVTGATNYKVQLSTDSLFINKIIDESLGNVAELDFENLNFNTKYFWRVQAFNNEDTANWSNIFRFNTILETPELMLPENNRYAVKLSSIFSWKVVNGAEKYILVVATDSMFINKVYSNENCINNFDTVFLTDKFRKYFWKVMAFRSTDSSDWSQIWKFTTEINSPTIIYPEYIALNLPLNIKFDWSNVNGAETYSFQLSKDALFVNTLAGIDTLTSNTFEYDKLEYNTTYYWRVRALRLNDSSDWSDTGIFTTLLGKVILTSPKDSSEGQESNILLSWSIVPGAQRYKLQVAEDVNFDSLIINNDSIQYSEYLAENLPDGKWLYWRVMAISGVKKSDWSEVFIFKTLKNEPLSRPFLISPLNGVNGFTTSGMFRWSKVKGASSYNLEVALDEDFSQSVEFKTGLKSSEILFTKYNLDTEYFWRVKAFRTGDSSDWSDTWEFTTGDEVSIPIFNIINPDDNATRVAVQGSINWTKVDSATAYYLQLAVDSEFDSTILDEGMITENYFDYSNLNHNTNYFLRIGCIVESGSIFWSETVNFLTELQTPSVTLPVHNSNQNLTIGFLKWSEVLGADGYDMRLSDDSFFNYLIIDVSNHHVNEYPYELSDSTTFYWMFRAVNDTNSSQWSSVYNFTTSTVINVDDLNYNLHFTLLSNPVTDEAVLEISLNNPSMLSISVVNIIGKIELKHNYNYMQAGHHTKKLDLSKLSNGFYILLIENGKKTQAIKLLKQ